MTVAFCTPLSIKTSTASFTTGNKALPIRTTINHDDQGQGRRTNGKRKAVIIIKPLRSSRLHMSTKKPSSNDKRNNNNGGKEISMTISKIIKLTATLTASVILGATIATTSIDIQSSNNPSNPDDKQQQQQQQQTESFNSNSNSTSNLNSNSNSNFNSIRTDKKNHLSISTSNKSIAHAYTQSTPTTKEDVIDYLPSEQTVISLFEKTTDSVAYVTTYMESRGGFSLNPMETPAGTGSGIVWDKEGRIVTNFHVIRAASGAKITLANKKVYDAELVGTSADDDVAVLKISAPSNELTPIELGNSTSLRVGQSTFAIGNPFGLDHTLTTGVLSGLGREMKSPTGRTISNVIQTEASINPGNSGGPLVNAKGQLIGMNTAIYSPSGASAGVGFAIPVNTLKIIANTLISKGKVIRPVIGISYLESNQAKALGVEKGVLILDVPEGSNAYKAGLRSTARQTFGSIVLGDVIIGVDDDEINNEGDLFKALDKHEVGDVVRLRVTNSDGERNLKLKLAASQN